MEPALLVSSEVISSNAQGYFFVSMLRDYSWFQTSVGHRAPYEVISGIKPAGPAMCKANALTTLLSLMYPFLRCKISLD